MVTGSGFEPGAALVASVCGAGAVDGTDDCAVASSASLIAAQGGGFSIPMVPAMPPVPCPCIVLVTETGGDFRATIPVSVAGAKTAPLPDRAAAEGAAELDVSGLHVRGGATLGSLFGGTAARSLELTLHNPGRLPVTPVLTARWGKGADGQNVIAVPAVRALAPGQSVKVRAAFRLDALSMGAYTVRVTVDQTGQYLATTDRSASTSTWPVGLLVVALVVVVLLLVGVARLVTRRRRVTEGLASLVP
jgi:hypothetical protein